MACVAGRSKVTVEIVESDSSQAGTAKFEVIVDSNPIGDNTIVSDSEIADIQKAINASETAAAKASASAQTAAEKAKEAKDSADIAQDAAQQPKKTIEKRVDTLEVTQDELCDVITELMYGGEE